MLDQLIYTGVMALPEIAGAAAEGAANLAVRAGKEAGRTVVAGLSDNAGEIAQSAGAGLARGLVQGTVSEIGNVGSDLLRGFLKK